MDRRETLRETEATQVGLPGLRIRLDQELQQCGRMRARLTRLNGLAQLLEMIDGRNDPRVMGILSLPHVHGGLEKTRIMHEVVVGDGAAMISHTESVDPMANLDRAEFIRAEVRVERS